MTNARIVAAPKKRRLGLPHLKCDMLSGGHKFALATPTILRARSSRRASLTPLRVPGDHALRRDLAHDLSSPQHIAAPQRFGPVSAARENASDICQIIFYTVIQFAQKRRLELKTHAASLRRVERFSIAIAASLAR